MTEDIREKLGGTYGTSFNLGTQLEPQQKISMNVSLGCDPTRVDELTAAVWGVLDEIIKNGPTEIDLDKAKKQLCSQREVAVKENGNWITWLSMLYNYDNKLVSLEDYKEQINALTIEDIKDFAKYLKYDEYVRTVLLPESMKK